MLQGRQRHIHMRLGDRAVEHAVRAGRIQHRRQVRPDRRVRPAEFRRPLLGRLRVDVDKADQFDVGHLLDRLEPGAADPAATGEHCSKWLLHKTFL